MGIFNNLFGSRKKENEIEILNNSDMAKKQNKIILSSGELFMNGKKVKYEVCQDPHYCVNITTYTVKETIEEILIPKEVEEEIKIFDLKKGEDETDIDYKKRKNIFDRVQLIRARGEKAELPEGYEVEEKSAKIKKMGHVKQEVKKEKEIEDKTEKINLYFRPMGHQVTELLRNFLNADI